MVMSLAVRAHLVRALEAELVGPYAEHEERDRAPSRTYLTGFLVPREDRNLVDLEKLEVADGE